MSKRDRTPKRGQLVWMIVNGQPAPRYFVQMHGTGCQVAFHTLQSKQKTADVYYEEVPLFFHSEADVLLMLIDGLRGRIAHDAEDLNRRLRQLEAALPPSTGD